MSGLRKNQPGYVKSRSSKDGRIVWVPDGSNTAIRDALSDYRGAEEDFYSDDTQDVDSVISSLGDSTIPFKRKYTQASSMPFMLNVIESVAEGSSSSEDIGKDTDLSKSRVDEYSFMAKSLGFVDIDKGKFSPTELGETFNDASPEDKAKILQHQMGRLSEVREYKSKGESLFTSSHYEKGTSELSIDKHVAIVRNYAQYSDNLSALVSAMVSDTREHGYSLGSKGSVSVAQWTCTSCFMKNAPAVDECEYCGEVRSA